MQAFDAEVSFEDSLDPAEALSLWGEGARAIGGYRRVEIGILFRLPIRN